MTASLDGYLASEEFGPKRYLLSGVLRGASDQGSVLEVTSGTLEELLDSARSPRSPMEVLEPLLLRIADSAPEFFGSTGVPLLEYPRYFLRSTIELQDMLSQLVRLRWAERASEGDGVWQMRLTLGGWQKVEELRTSVPSSRQAFVAMAFTKELDDAWLNGIRPALIETGYHPFRVDKVQHNGKIDDKIVAELRRSGLVIADFTNHRNGVYFEAGFGIGRGIPVIWTCRDDDIQQAHFDTRQYNHITWLTPGELRRKLGDRIRATLPVYPAIQSASDESADDTED